MSRIVTFYSYKGGVGRTFALANIAVLLAKRGKRVLVMDWDLEAPGLHRYFRPFIEQAAPRPEGLIHMLSRAESDPMAQWKEYLTKISITGCEPINIIPSGDQAPDYVERIREFSWNKFFEDHAGGDLLNRWRNEWKASYDFVLVDSRTGITDTGGICTIYLPDILVLVFSANEQSFERGVQVATGVQRARRELSVPRPPLAVLPLPGRFDGRDEIDEAQMWLDRFATELKLFYDDWLPKDLKARQILELTKIPYITKFSFGEPLPVIAQGTTDPEFPGFYLENVARLLVSDFQDAHQIVLPEGADRLGSIAELRTMLASAEIDEAAVARLLTRIESEIGSASRFSELLTEVGISFFRQQQLDTAESYFRRALSMSTDAVDSSHPAVRSNMNHLAELLMASGRLSEAEMLYRRIAELDVDFDSPTQWTTYTNLANVYRQMGRLDEALSWYRQALDHLELTEHVGDSAALAIYSNIAAIYREMGRSEDAICFYERALYLAERTDRPGDSAALAMYNNLAAVYLEMGRSEDAIRFYERALYLAEMSDRPGDSAVLATYNNLAALYREMGRSEDAIRFYERALNLAEMTGRPGDSAVLTTYNNLAAVYLEMGRSEDAIRFYERALNLAETTGRIGGTAILATYNNLAAVYREIGRSKDAIHWYKRALEMANLMARPGDSAALAAYNSLAGIHRDSGDREEATRWYERALNVVIGTFGSESTQAAAQLGNLADILIEEQRIDEAEPLLRRALDILLVRRENASPLVARIRASLTRLLESSGRNEEATEIAHESRFDVLIAYGSKDSIAARDLANKLVEKSLRVWYDQWQLRPGDLIEQAIADAIASTPSVLICIGQSIPNFWMEDGLAKAWFRREQQNQLIIPVLLPKSDPDQIPPFLRQYQFLDLRRGLTNTNIDRLLSSITRRKRRS